MRVLSVSSTKGSFDAFGHINDPTFSRKYGDETILTALVAGWDWRMRCVACGWRGAWPARELRCRFVRFPHIPTRKVAARLRCGGCRSPKVVVEVYQSDYLDVGPTAGQSRAEREAAILAGAERQRGRARRDSLRLRVEP